MKRIGLAGAGLALVFLAAGTLYAQPKSTEHKWDGQREEMTKELNLTPEQQAKIEENRKAGREQMMKITTALKEKQAKLQEELKNPAVTRQGVMPLVSEIKALEAQLVDRRMDGIFAVKQIMTPEQFIKFQQKVEERQKDRKERFDKGSGKNQGRSW